MFKSFEIRSKTGVDTPRGKVCVTGASILDHSPQVSQRHHSRVKVQAAFTKILLASFGVFGRDLAFEDRENKKMHSESPGAVVLFEARRKERASAKMCFKGPTPAPTFLCQCPVCQSVTT